MKQNLPFVCLAVDLDWLVPSPHALDKLLVLLASRIELGELVALVIRSDVECWERLVAANKESSLDDGVIGDSIDRGATEEVLAAGLETVEETT